MGEAEHRFFECDVTSLDHIQETCKEIKAAAGSSLAILVNNAGRW